MDELIPTLLEFPPSAINDFEYDAQLKSYVSRLRKIPKSHFTSGDILDILDPSQQTIPYLFALNAYIDASEATGKAQSRSLPRAVLPEGNLWPYITNLLLGFDPVQARYAGIKLKRIVDVVALGAEQTSNFIPAIQLLHHVILRLDSSSSTLTSTHFVFIRLCLLARAFSEGADILNRPIYSIAHVQDIETTVRSHRYLCSADTPGTAYLSPRQGLTTKWDSRSYLEYFLVGAMIYIGLAQFEQALFFLEVVISAPAAPNTASAIMVEAYKKWALVNLLQNGKGSSPPKGASSGTIKQIRAVSKPYDCLTEAFESGSMDRLRGEISEGQEVWEIDTNTGLVFAVFNAFRKFSVLKLAKTFVALSVLEVAQKIAIEAVDVHETMSFISSLISAGELNATLTPASRPDGTPTLRFFPTSSVKSEREIQQDVAHQAAEVQHLLRYVLENDHRLEITKEYIGVLQKLKKQKDQEAKNMKEAAGGPSARQATANEDDEDMMADL